MSNSSPEVVGNAIDRRLPSHIVLATDFGARCDRAQDRAVQLAMEWNASLTAVHALDDLGLATDTSARDAYRRAVMRSAKRLREDLACIEGLRASVVVDEGAPEAVILALAARERADLIVTGIAGTGPLSLMSIGSTVTALARSSPIPLLVVKKKVLDTNARTLVATDLTASSKLALLVSLNWFSHRYHTLFHAYDAPYRIWVDDKAAYEREFEGSALRECRDFVTEVAGQHALDDFDIAVRWGDAVNALRVLVDEADIDLVIAGTHGRTGVMHVLLGSVASRILNEIQSDVLVVPSQSR